MFLAIKMYPREGQDSSLTNYNHAEAGMKIRRPRSHNLFQFFTSSGPQ